MANVGTVLTLGLATGETDSSFILLGFGIGIAPPEPVADTGGGVWLEGLRRKRIQQLRASAARAVAEAESKRQWKQKARAKRRAASLRELRDVLVEAEKLDLPEHDAEAVSAAVEPFAPETFDGRITPAGTINWRLLYDDSAAVARLAGVLLEITLAVEQDEEEAAYVMMMLH